jgi:membrane fusion protein (multidrug efflux system)
MPNENGTRTIDADQKQTVALVDHETPGSLSKETPVKNATTRGKRVLGISAAIVVAIAGSYFAWNAFRYEDTDDAQIDGHVMQLSARINGQIKDVYVVEGQLVHAGDVLVAVDSQDYKIAEAQAQANLADAQATAASSHWKVPITSVTVQSNLDSAKTAVLNAEAAVRASEQNNESAKATLVQARANAVKSDADLQRATQLIAKEDISPAVRPGGRHSNSKSSGSRFGTGGCSCCRTSRAASTRETLTGKK